MNILLDHCVPKQFGRLLLGHTVRTAGSLGLGGIGNGLLLAAARDRGFDAFITVDRNLSFQQNKNELPLPVIAIMASSNRIDALEPVAGEVLRILSEKLQRRAYLVRSSR
jgi:hypothetical protein